MKHFSNNVAKKELRRRCLPAEIPKFFWTAFWQNTSGHLILKLDAKSLKNCFWIYWIHHCVKSVQTRSLFWSVFPVFSLTMRKYGSEKTTYLDTFHAVHFHAFSNTRSLYQINIYLFRSKKRNTRKSCEICSKLTIKTLERRQWRRSGIFIVNFEHILHLFLVFLLLTL